jgi:ATP-dependent Lhr-like helicase
MTTAERLPERFETWFASRGWTARGHQLDLLEKAGQGRSVLLVAPTGAGKTLAGFLPSLVELSGGRRSHSAGASRGIPPGSLHTLYISPLKALAIDVARNLETPVREMDLPIRIETRTGDTPPHKRARQIERPPDILLTTPEQVSLLVSSRSAADLFGGLRRVILDELHALVTSKRGDLLALALARLRTLAPGLTSIGLSATVREPDELRRYLVGQSGGPSARNKQLPPELPAEQALREGSSEDQALPQGSAEGRAPQDEVTKVGAGLGVHPMADLVVVEGRGEARHPHAGTGSAAATRRPHGLPDDSGDLRSHRPAQNDPRVRQHAFPGRVRLSGIMAGERGQPRYRAPPRLAQR